MTGKVAAKLTRDQFARALAHGRGAALMHVQAHGIAEVEDLFVQACINEQSYDPQCEGHRAAWLYRFFKGSSRYPEISAVLLTGLKFDDDEPCCAQLCEIVALMAIDGDAAAATALRDYVWNQEADGECLSGARAICLLDGVPAVVEVARRHGRILLAVPNDYVDGFAYLLDDDSPVRAAALAELEKVSVTDPAVAAFLDQHKRDTARNAEGADLTIEERAARREAYFEEQSRKVKAERILQIASDGGTPSNGELRLLGRYAPAGELDQILRHLAFESNPAVCKTLLRIFRWASLPRMHPRVWELAHDQDREMRNLAALALASLADPVVGELGRSRMRAADLSPEEAHVLRLFTKHLQSGDEELILPALQKLELDPDQFHEFGHSVRDILSENEAPALARWLYDTNPCTICRESAVEALLQANAMPEDVAEECRHDASDDIRALVGAPAA